MKKIREILIETASRLVSGKIPQDIASTTSKLGTSTAMNRFADVAKAKAMGESEEIASLNRSLENLKD